MLQELTLLEAALIEALKNILLNPSVLATDLHVAYSIYRDLKGIANGETKNGS